MDTEIKARIAAAIAKGRVPREDVEREIQGTYHREELAGFDKADLQAYLEETA